MKSVKKKQTRIIPGFGLSMGITITILSVVVLIPLASLIIYTAKLSPQEIWETKEYFPVFMSASLQHLSHP